MAIVETVHDTHKMIVEAFRDNTEFAKGEGFSLRTGAEIYILFTTAEEVLRKAQEEAFSLLDIEDCVAAITRLLARPDVYPCHELHAVTSNLREVGFYKLGIATFKKPGDERYNFLVFPYWDGVNWDELGKRYRALPKGKTE